MIDQRKHVTAESASKSALGNTLDKIVADRGVAIPDNGIAHERSLVGFGANFNAKRAATLFNIFDHAASASLS